MQVPCRIRLPDVLMASSSFNLSRGQNSAMSTLGRLTTRCQLPFATASAMP